MTTWGSSTPPRQGSPGRSRPLGLPRGPFPSNPSLPLLFLRYFFSIYKIFIYKYLNKSEAEEFIFQVLVEIHFVDPPLPPSVPPLPLRPPREVGSSGTSRFPSPFRPVRRGPWTGHVSGSMSPRLPPLLSSHSFFGGRGVDRGTPRLGPEKTGSDTVCVPTGPQSFLRPFSRG